MVDELGRRASLLKDRNRYVVDIFNPYELGRRATINVGTRHASGGATVYAVPVADEERSAALANATAATTALSGGNGGNGGNVAATDDSSNV